MPRWRNMLLFKNSLMQSTIPTTSSSSLYFVSIHSTPNSCEKWKKKWDPDSNGQQPSKTYIKYETRHKRSDAKKALKNLLFHSGSCKTTFENVHNKVETTKIWGQEQRDHSNSSNKKGRSKASARASKARHQKKHQSSKDSSFEDFDGYSETYFQATFGGRCYTWSYKSAGERSFQSSSSGFEWREHPNWTNSNRDWDAAHEIYSDSKSCFPGSSSDRKILGLPIRGPLKIEDVKTAFRSSALKWHPDKHQGPSQAMAEERFKHCADAYKSLCNALA